MSVKHSDILCLICCLFVRFVVLFILFDLKCSFLFSRVCLLQSYHTILVYNNLSLNNISTQVYFLGQGSGNITEFQELLKSEISVLFQYKVEHFPVHYVTSLSVIIRLHHR